MKKLIFFSLILNLTTVYAQNVKIDICDLSRSIDGKEYATYQFASASYSYSRATLILITNKKTLLEIGPRLAALYKEKKQEYTDVWILGVTNFNQAGASKTDQKIIDTFLQKIIKYRADNTLPLISLERMKSNKIFLKKADDICIYLSCRNKL